MNVGMGLLVDISDRLYIIKMLPVDYSFYIDENEIELYSDFFEEL
jgi:hypothetical protein